MNYFLSINPANAVILEQFDEELNSITYLEILLELMFIVYTRTTEIVPRNILSIDLYF